MTETILRNTRIVTADDCFLGHVVLAEGLIREIGRGDTAASSALDLAGDLLLPGLVELHTDNLERHRLPRPGVLWDADAATLAHDAHCATAGITTVLDAVMIGSHDQGGARSSMQESAIQSLQRCRDGGLMRIDHLLHLRCEVATADILQVLARHVDRPDLRLVSVMDHTAGQRQWRDLAKYRQYMERNGRYTEAAFEQMLEVQHDLHVAHAASHRRTVVLAARQRGIPVASHDDTELAHVIEAQGEGITMSEFPTTLVAAQAARQAGMAIIMGGPNLVRGGSHSGNVAAAELAEQGLLDIVSSDYVPSSLLMSAFELHQGLGWALPRAVAAISRSPARSIGLHDRGEIAVGLRADLIRVRLSASDGAARGTVLQTWRQGQRVA